MPKGNNIKDQEESPKGNNPIQNIKIKFTKTGRPRKLTRRRKIGQKIPLFLIKGQLNFFSDFKKFSLKFFHLFQLIFLNQKKIKKKAKNISPALISETSWMKLGKKEMRQMSSDMNSEKKANKWKGRMQTKRLCLNKKRF